jgi:hypothetical protein
MRLCLVFKVFQKERKNSMSSSDAVIEKNDLFQSEQAISRPMIRLGDFDSARDADISTMFGSWKETDHCDKDIRK